MFTDEPRRSVWDQVRQRDIQQFAGILTPELFASAAQRAGLRMGAGALNLANLTWLAISAALRPGLCFAKILGLTFKLLSDMDRLDPSLMADRTAPAGQRGGKRASAAQRGKSRRTAAKSSNPPRSKHDPRKEDATQLSEEAFAQARRVMPSLYFHALLWLLGELCESRFGERLRWNGMRLLALDGTLISLPRRAALRDHFGVARNQHKSAGTPQARMVMLQLSMARLPWRYRITPRKQGESTAAAQLLADLRQNDMVLMDRGFFHFNLFRQIQDANAFFATRTIKRVRFKTVRRLGKDDRIVTWKPAARRWKGASLRLRVINYHVNGFRKTAIVTNQLDASRVSREQFVGLSDSSAWQSEKDAGLYHRRWEIETTFAEMKAQLKMESGLRGLTPPTIEYELGGCVLLYMLVRWTMMEAAEAHGVEPLRLSFKNALEEIQYAAGYLPIASEAQRERLLEKLLERIAKGVVPYRPGRHYPRPNDEKNRYTGKGHRLRPSKIGKKKA
jgi:hypothetical protein